MLSFGYSSLSRLLNAYNPESGWSCYGYDLDANLTSRTSGASGCSPVTGGVTVTYNPYDNLNQPTTKTYSDGTPSVTYGYTVDWLKSVTAGSNVFQNVTFDGLGRVTSSSQTTNGTVYTFPTYQYNLADGLTSMNMPSGRVVNTPRDTANRITSVQGTLGSTNTTYVYPGSLSYTPHGALSQMELGNNLWDSRGYNSRLQATTMKLGTSAGASDLWSLTNAFSAAQNNGNVLTQSLTAPGMGTLSTAYLYDSVNRLSIAAENSSNPSNPPCPDAASQWCRQYNYASGGYGNRKTSASGGQGTSPLEPGSFNTSNRIADAGWGYDSRGNVTQNKTGATFAYDAEGRQTAYCPNDANPANCTQTAGNGRTLYYYDGQGHQVMTQAADGTTTVFVYDTAGNLAAEYASQPPPMLCTTCYVTTDHLGSTRVETDASGCPVYREDYLPFGEAILPLSGSLRLNATGGTKCTTNGYQTATNPRVQFTGKERDAETGLDWFESRYFSGAQGRFTSPDDPLADQHPEDPQSWNVYSYVRNNPLRYGDPSGRECVKLDGGGIGDDGQGNACQDKSLQTTHGVTVNGTTGEVTSGVYGNAVLMGDIDLSGRKDRITGQSAEIVSTLTNAKAILGIAKVGLTVGSLALAMAKLKPAEQAILEELIAAGKTVEVIPTAEGRTADFLVNGVPTELKTLTAAGPTTLKNAVQNAAKQGEQILIDARNVNMTPQEALGQIQRAQGNIGGLQGRVTVLTKGGTITF